jgi:hypothetical protein
MYNRIDINPTNEQLAAARAAAISLSNALPFLVALDTDERVKMLKMGERTEGFVRSALEAARQHPETLLALLDVEALERDLSVRDELAPFELLFATMLQKVQDTRRLAGRDLYSGCLDIYQSLQRYGGTEGVDASLVQLRKRFKRGPRVSGETDAAENAA